MNKGNKLDTFLKTITFHSFRAFRRLVFFVLLPFGKSKRKIIDTFLYGFLRRVWNSLPTSLTNFTITMSVKENIVKFRPFILHDFLFVLSNHEPFFKDLFCPKIGEIVVDVGAHIGLYTLKAANLVGKTGKVISVEPDPRNYELLKENIKLNKLENVIPLNVALSDFCGQKLFYGCMDPSLSGLNPSSESPICEPTLTQIFTIDALLQRLNIKEINWLKIDVEGEETRVVKGALSTLKNSRQVVVLIESAYNDCIKLLKKYNFETKYLGEIYFFAIKRG